MCENRSIISKFGKSYVHKHTYTANMAISRGCDSSLYTVEMLLRTRVGIRDIKGKKGALSVVRSNRGLQRALRVIRGIKGH
jgi:hypothetical protein